MVFNLLVLIFLLGFVFSFYNGNICFKVYGIFYSLMGFIIFKEREDLWTLVGDVVFDVWRYCLVLVFIRVCG